MSLQFSRRSFTGYAAYKRSHYMPPLSEAQAEALDALHFTAMKHQLKMQLEKGDIQFINNVALVHAREAFRDEPENRYAQFFCLLAFLTLSYFLVLTSDSRHLLRLWLRDEEFGWEVPAPLKGVWEGVFGGMSGKEECQVFPAAPVVRGAQYGL